MGPQAAERFHIAGRLLDGRRGRPALWRGASGRASGGNRSTSGGGVRQVIVGHELTWRPALSGIGYGRLSIELWPDPRRADSGRAQRTYLYNVGGSPAVCATYVYRRESRGWFLSTPVDVPVHGVETEVLRGQPLEEQIALRVLDSIGETDALAGAIFCRDFLERRWCFPIPEREHGANFEPIVWRKGSHAPVWATSSDLWSRQVS